MKRKKRGATNGRKEKIKNALNILLFILLRCLLVKWMDPCVPFSILALHSTPWPFPFLLLLSIIFFSPFLLVNCLRSAARRTADHLLTTTHRVLQTKIKRTKQERCPIDL